MAAQLDLEIASDQVTDILSRLGLAPEFDGQTWRCTAPSWRHDISIEQDLVEEIARVYGYDNLPSKMPVVRQMMPRIAESVRDKNRVRAQLVDLGLNEVITYSFVSPALHQRFHDDETAMDLANPITADLVRMRQSMVPGMAQTAVYNLNRQNKGVALFEIGQCFIRSDETLNQLDRIGMILAGELSQWDWMAPARDVDFFDLKGIVEALGADLELAFEPVVRQGMHPGRCARVMVAGQEAGYIGALHPQVAADLDLPSDTYVADLSLVHFSQSRVAQFSPLSKFPSSGRDFALLVSNQSWADIKNVIEQAGGPLLKSVTLFDVYRGQGLEPGSASLAVHLAWRDQEATLEEAVLNQLADDVLSALDQKLGVKLR